MDRNPGLVDGTSITSLGNAALSMHVCVWVLGSGGPEGLSQLCWGSPQPRGLCQGEGTAGG